MSETKHKYTPDELREFLDDLMKPMTSKNRIAMLKQIRDSLQPEITEQEIINCFVGSIHEDTYTSTWVTNSLKRLIRLFKSKGFKVVEK